MRGEKKQRVVRVAISGASLWCKTRVREPAPATLSPSASVTHTHTTQQHTMALLAKSACGVKPAASQARRSRATVVRAVAQADAADVVRCQCCVSCVFRLPCANPRSGPGQGGEQVSRSPALLLSSRDRAREQEMQAIRSWLALGKQSRSHRLSARRRPSENARPEKRSN